MSDLSSLLGSAEGPKGATKPPQRDIKPTARKVKTTIPTQQSQRDPESPYTAETTANRINMTLLQREIKPPRLNTTTIQKKTTKKLNMKPRNIKQPPRKPN